MSRDGSAYKYDDQLLAMGGAVVYDYDDNGFRAHRYKDDSCIEYAYTSTGQLISVTHYAYNSEGEGSWELDVAEPAISYQLDALGRRAAKLVDNDVQERYLWAGHNTTLLAVYGPTGTTPTARFEYGVGRMPVRMTQGNDVYYFAYDQVGSLRAVFDDAGALVHEITYDSYGNIITDETTQGFESVYIPPFGFAGGLHDRDTDMVLFGFRDYDPETGTWLTPDPIGFVGGDVYLYGYCGGDPVNYVDPVGLCGINIGSGLSWWDPYGWNVPGPYGSADPSEWDSFSNPGSWNNIFVGPQQGTGWGTAQISSVVVASAMAGGALALGGIEFAFLGNASISMLGTAYAAPLGTPAVPYSTKVLEKMANDPTYHGWPVMFENIIYQSKPIIQTGGRMLYTAQGFVNNIAGQFEIVVKNGTVVIHHFFNKR